LYFLSFCYGFFQPVTVSVKHILPLMLFDRAKCAGLPASVCPDCGEERLLMFSCKTRGFCSSCHAERPEEWGEWMRFLGKKRRP